MIYDILKELNAEPSEKGKEAILKQHKDNEVFKKVLYYTLNKLVTFGVKDLSNLGENEVDSSLVKPRTLSEVMEGLLPTLISREYTGGRAREAIAEALISLGADDKEVLRCILRRELRVGTGEGSSCGVGKTLVNKVFKGLIPKTPYMGAQPYTREKVDSLFATYPFYVVGQIKEDGMFAHMIVTEEGVTLETRHGHQITNIPESKFRYQKWLVEYGGWKPYVLDGELLMRGVGRAQSNGIIKSIVAGTKTPEEYMEKYGMTLEDCIDRIHYRAWDCLSLEDYAEEYSSLPYNRRVDNLGFIVQRNVTCVTSKALTSHKEAKQWLKEVLKDGEEGLIIKSPVGEWVNKKPDYQIKMKTEFSVDLQAVEVLPGKKGGKFQNTTGSILCKSICGKLECKATGFESDAIRHELWERKEELEQGAIIEVKSNGITSNSKGTFSLLNPICKGERIDKSKADNLFEIEASLEGSYYE